MSLDTKLRRRSPAAPPRLADVSFGLGGVLAGTANVIMQLSWPAIGQGVIESRVESGQVMRHPLKRFRTTFTYLSVASMGTAAEKAAYRKAVNRSHAQVRSTADSPVAYDAFSPDLQLWVAACLYYGAADLTARTFGPMSDGDADAHYQDAATLATTLQVGRDRWPATRAEFAAYWEQGVGHVAISPQVRRYLDDLTNLRFLPPWISRCLGPVNAFFTVAFLPPELRTAMGYTWTQDDDARFARVERALALMARYSPGPVRRFPFNWYLWDLRVRRRLGLPLV